MKNCVETLHEKLEEKIGREFRMKLSTPCNHFFYREKNNNVLKKIYSKYNGR